MNPPGNSVVGSFFRPATDGERRVLPRALVLRLQRTVGNREVTRLLLARAQRSAVAPEASARRSVLPIWAYALIAVLCALLGAGVALLGGLPPPVVSGIALASGCAAIGLAYVVRARQRRGPD